VHSFTAYVFPPDLVGLAASLPAMKSCHRESILGDTNRHELPFRLTNSSPEVSLIPG
jgi:hypothetical protein